MELWSLIIGVASLIVGVVSIVLGIYAIIYTQKESSNSEGNYQRAKDLLVNINYKTEHIDRGIQLQQNQLVDIINKTLDKVGAMPIEIEEITAEEIDALFEREMVKVEVPNKAGGKTVVIDRPQNIGDVIGEQLSSKGSDKYKGERIVGKKYLVDLADEASFVDYQEQLCNQWHFTNDNVAKVLEHYKHNGQVKQFQEIHYLILHDLIELHLERLEVKERTAFLAYNKSRLISMYNANALSTLGTFMASVLSLFFTTLSAMSENGTVDVVSVIMAFLIWVVWNALNLLSIKVIGSPANDFYESLFAAFDEKLSAN